MLKKIIMSIGLMFLFSHISFAETCPNVDDIKQNRAKGWALYDSEEGTPLDARRTAEYRKSIEQFALAEWTNTSHKTGSMHCYYRDKSGSTFEAYAGKHDFVPTKSAGYWYQVSGFTQCAAASEKCIFQTNVLKPERQLARR